MFGKEVYIARRKALLERLAGQKGVALFIGNVDAPAQYKDNSYKWRQDSSWLYLFGIDEPRLAATIDLETGEETLYGDDFTLDDIIWMGPVQLGQVFAQGIVQVFGGIDHLEAGERGVVLGHGHVLDGDEALLALKALEIGHDESAGHLPRAVRAEVEEDHAVALFHGGQGLAVLFDHGGDHEFVGLAVVIAVLHGVHGVGLPDALAQRDGVVALFHAVPDIVAVHAPEAALDRRHLAHADLLHFGDQLPHIIDGGSGRHVAPV